ncbi:phosphodiesterase [Robiginitomaculum antarcticum]|uniref:phosphodiesterase n=1 Tax=Robiginitomaculum antarcticum TaxID=437507 RepID=UPI00037CDE8F|nr:phosphodiesterase [Robiginitomaculum antarcticum]
MLIAQITDLHIGFDGPGPGDENTKRFKDVLAWIGSLIKQPDMIFLTGDLVESGEVRDYKTLKAIASTLNVPVYMGMGNHDRRAAYLSVFRDSPQENGFIQYAVEHDGLRFIMLDTLKEGRHGGGFCEGRANWMDKTLSEKPDMPTLIAMHHPPIETQIPWMTSDNDAPWVKRFRAVVDKHKNIIHIMSGHIHRPISQRFSHTSVSVSPATAPQVKFEIADMDLNTPDNRPLLVESRPGLCLHHWDGGHVTTHTVYAPEGKPIIRFDKDHAYIPKMTRDISEPR